MTTPYELGVKLALEETLTKEAGLREFLRFLGTGRTTAYHGTSEGIAKAIRESKGIIPRKSKGVSDVFIESGAPDPTAGRRLSFLTRSWPEARNYARQQGFIEATGATPPLFGAQAGREIAESGIGELIPQARKLWGGVRGARRGARRGVVEARIPRGAVKRQVNPEAGVLRDKMENLLDDAIPQYSEQVAQSVPSKLLTNWPFRRTFGVQSPNYWRGPAFRGEGTKGLPRPVKPQAGTTAAIPSRHIVGSPSYQGVTRDEVVRHLKETLRNPKETAIEALRNLTGIERLIS